MPPLTRAGARDGRSASCLSVARIAEDLAATRTRARSLLLEVQTRLAALPASEPRRERLARFVKQWPRLGRIEADGNRLRMVIDDPFLRDVLRNHAYESGIDIDTSFASEIVTLSWPSYVALLESLAGEEGVEEGGRALRRRRPGGAAPEREAAAGVRRGDA
jgi:hypothetical protein